MISRRLLEILTASLTGVFGLAVAISSFDNGIGWSSGGVDAGTVPFSTGIVILARRLSNLGRGEFAGPARPQRSFVTAAADVSHAARLRNHSAFEHVLGRAVRRLRNLDPVQYSRRAVIGGNDFRRVSD